MKSTDAPVFEEHCVAALEGLRAALTELHQAVGADPHAPQEVARLYGLNRNLTWKVSRVMRAEGALDVFQHLPGSAGLHIFLDAFLSKGAPAVRVEEVRASIAEFERMVKLHAEDRATLELMLESLFPTGTGSEALEASRRLAFQGNSGIWGVQAKTRLRTSFLAPNPAQPDWMDAAQLVGVLGLRRLRHGAAWPLLERRSLSAGGDQQHAEEQPLFPSQDPEPSFMLTDFCSRPQPEVSVRPTGYGSVYEQVDGRLGNSGRVDCVYGSRRVQFARRDEAGEGLSGEFSSSIDAPVEHMIFDMIVHKDLVGAGFQVEGGVLQRETPAALVDGGPRLRLPSPERVFRLGSAEPRVVSPLVPRYAELVQRVYDAMGWNPADFRGWRFEMKFPPLPCTAVLSYRLPGSTPGS